MKGKILGYANAEGVINGDDGKRYKFTSSDWKAPRPPKVGEEVDFVVSAQGGGAEIYPVHASAGLDLGSVDLGKVGAQAKELIAAGSSSPAGARALSLLTSRLSVPLALVMLIVSIFFNYVAWNGQELSQVGVTRSGGYSVIGVSSLSSSVGEFFSTIGKQADAQASVLQQQLDAAKQAGVSDTAELQQTVDGMHGAARGASMFGLELDLMYLLYLVPLGAIFILYREWVDQPMPLVGLVVGGLGVFGFLLAFIAKWTANGAIKDFMGPMLQQAGLAGFGLSVGFGSWLLLICGAVLVLNALGIVRLGSQASAGARA